MPKDAPPKRGLFRLLEVLGRDLGNLVKLNLIVAALLLPAELLLAAAAVWFLAGRPLFWLWLLPAVGAGLVAGPALTALFQLTTKMLRDQPGFLWHDFKAAFRGSFRQTAAAGAVLFVIVGSWVFAGLAMALGPGSSLPMAGLIVSVVLVCAISPYYFLQAAYIDLPAGPLLKNSLLLALGQAPRSLLGALLGGGLVVAQALLLPYTLPALLLLGYALPALLCMLCIWPPVDKQFSIDETLRKRAQPTDDSVK